ncbi:uncharacterized protein [Watersipora subatra]|uniref:uncharacterized protein n=1 Tax=Watersipora subatra TaxID=2589382 RepID=UPI00355BDFFF
MSKCDSEISGIVALDFFPTQPYYKKAWELSDESSHLVTWKSDSSQNTRNCSYYPETDPDFSIFPAVDVNTQMLATPDHYIVITTPVGLLAIKDHGTSGEQVSIGLFGAHFLSLDTTPTMKGMPPLVWMTGWRQYPPFRESLIAFNYSDTNFTEPMIVISLGPCLGAADINVTSRIASFPDPSGAYDKVLVFGVSVNTTSSQVPFHQKYCPECKPGINKMLMVIHSSLINTEQPDILWMTKLPAENWEVRGQIIGVKDKLITFLSNEKSGNIAAFS